MFLLKVVVLANSFSCFQQIYQFLFNMAMPLNCCNSELNLVVVGLGDFDHIFGSQIYNYDKVLKNW
jgi:hypothetical protein